MVRTRLHTAVARRCSSPQIACGNKPRCSQPAMSHAECPLMPLTFIRAAVMASEKPTGSLLRMRIGLCAENARSRSRSRLPGDCGAGDSGGSPAHCTAPLALPSGDTGSSAQLSTSAVPYIVAPKPGPGADPDPWVISTWPAMLPAGVTRQLGLEV